MIFYTPTPGIAEVQTIAHIIKAPLDMILYQPNDALIMCFSSEAQHGAQTHTENVSIYVGWTKAL